MNTKKSKAIFTLILTMLGLSAGYLYYELFGCKTGCSITSSPGRTMIYFAIMFALISTIFWKDNKKDERS
ncbi:MAG TPA: hypothetical protein VJZ04_02675 [Lachnospiraceae bacterium]|nr:hypothetical protein [Lachnospiraceae bacterium]